MSEFESSRGITVRSAHLGDIRVGDVLPVVIGQRYAEALVEFLEHEAAEKEAREARPWEFANDGTVWRLVEGAMPSTQRGFLH